MGSDGPGLAWPMFFLQACEALLSCRISPEEADGGCGERPRAMRMAALGARGAGTFPRRCLGALDETASGGKLLYARETGDRMEVVEPHEAAALAHTGQRWPQRPGMGGMGLGRVDAGAFDVAQQLIGVGQEREIAGDALVPRRIGQALGAPLAVGFVGNL